MAIYLAISKVINFYYESFMGMKIMHKTYYYLFNFTIYYFLYFIWIFNK